MVAVDDAFLTVADVAALLQLNQQTVRNWIDAGSLPATRVGRRVRIRQSDLDQLLAAGETSVGDAPGQIAPRLDRVAWETLGAALSATGAAVDSRSEAELAEALNQLAAAAASLATALDPGHVAAPSPL